MNTMTIVPEHAALPPAGVFHGMVFCQLGKSQLMFIHADQDFGQVAEHLLNAALGFLAKSVGEDALPFTVEQGFPSISPNGSVHAVATVAHPTVTDSWAIQAYTNGPSSGSVDMDHSLASVVNAKGVPLLTLANKRAHFFVQTRLGFYRLPERP